MFVLISISTYNYINRRVLLFINICPYCSLARSSESSEIQILKMSFKGNGRKKPRERQNVSDQLVYTFYKILLDILAT